MDMNLDFDVVLYSKGKQNKKSTSTLNKNRKEETRWKKMKIHIIIKSATPIEPNLKLKKNEGKVLKDSIKFRKLIGIPTQAC